MDEVAVTGRSATTTKNPEWPRCVLASGGSALIVVPVGGVLMTVCEIY